MAEDRRGHWGTRLGFIMAAAGSAIGLGNVWKFPYVAGENGGGAFVLVYLVCVLAVGIPVMVAEFALGRSTEQNPIGAFEKLEGRRNGWIVPGLLGVISAFVILSFYSVVAGWVLDYMLKAVVGTFAQADTAESLVARQAEIEGMLGGLLKNYPRQLTLHFVFMALTTGVVIFGVRNGIERASNILMPALLAILLCLFCYSFSLRGNAQALEFLFRPDFGKLKPEGVLRGLTHAFFTLSLGMGAMITYGSYLRRDQNIVKSAIVISAMDTVIALMAGVVIFSIVFTCGGRPGEGAGLIFVTLSSLFIEIPGGTALSIAFFLLLAFAALTSAISIMEVVCAYFIDAYNFSRAKVALVVGLVAYLLGVPSALSTNELRNFNLPFKSVLGGAPETVMTFFDAFEKAADLLLSWGGLLIAVYVGWRMKKHVFENEFDEKWRRLVPPVRGLLRFVAPVLVLAVCLYGMAFSNPLFEKLGIVGIGDAERQTRRYRAVAEKAAAVLGVELFATKWAAFYIHRPDLTKLKPYEDFDDIYFQLGLENDTVAHQMRESVCFKKDERNAAFQAEIEKLGAAIEELAALAGSDDRTKIAVLKDEVDRMADALAEFAKKEEAQAHECFREFRIKELEIVGPFGK